MKKPYLHILPRAEGAPYASFDLYLPAGEADGREFYTCYRFVYEENPVKPSLTYGEGPNDPANRRFYRIKTAFMTERDGDGFRVLFRALQGGEIGLAFRETGAGDFVGGLHGDEVLTDVSLTVDGMAVALDRPFLDCFETFSFRETSRVDRCNTPDEHLLLHTQEYTVEGNTLRLSQRVEWLRDSIGLQAAYMPMLTAQRLDPADPDRILSDTVEFYRADGTLSAIFDTTPYGRENGGRSWDVLGKWTPATAVRVYGRESGFSAEAGYTVVDGTIPEERCRAYLCVRYMKNAFDNKIYFEIGGGIAPKKDTVWRTDVYYRIAYAPKERDVFSS